MSGDKKNIIIYNTADGKASVSLYAKDGMVWMNQNQIAQLFATSKQNIGQHIANILKEEELSESSVVKNFFTTAADGKQYKVTYYALDMVLAIGFRVSEQAGNPAQAGSTLFISTGSVDMNTKPLPPALLRLPSEIDEVSA